MASMTGSPVSESLLISSTLTSVGTGVCERVLVSHYTWVDTVGWHREHYILVLEAVSWANFNDLHSLWKSTGGGESHLKHTSKVSMYHP